MLRAKLITILLILSVAFCAFLITCSNENDNPTGPDPQPDKVDLITVTPLSGSPGTALTINGLQFDTARVASYTAYLDGEAAPFKIDGDTLVKVAIPLFFDSALGWSSPPTDSVSLEIYLNDTLIAYSDTSIEIDSLPHATGTTEIIKNTIDTVLSNFRVLFDELPAGNTWEKDYRDSLFSIINLLINGPDTSLAAIMNGTSSMLNGVPVNLELTDALLHSTGALDYWNNYLSSFASSVGKLQNEISSLQSSGLLCDGFGPDMDLACKMQFYVMLDDWANEFLAETRTEWSNSIGWVIDAIALIPGAELLPPVAVGKLISVVLTISDVLVNNVVLSVLPSHITNFNMTLASNTMDVDQFTNSQIFITAANSPEQMTINEMVDLVLAVVGLRKSAANNLTTIVLKIIQFVVDKLRMVYSWLSAIAPDVFVDPNLVDGTWYGFPDIIWGPIEVQSHDLVELYSFTPDTLSVDSAAFEWWSINCGEGRIQARTRGAGARSKVFKEWMFCVVCEYTGGAFGNDMMNTATQTVTIGTKGNLVVTTTGLPSGEDADIIVIYPDGTTFDHITSTDTLQEIGSGEYEVQANEVIASDGTAYIGKPKTQMADVTCDNTFTANIEYVEKYGNILLTVSGLPSGVEADIDVSGPGGTAVHVICDTLIDSLIEGTYSIKAFDITDPATNDLISPDPKTQTVDVISGETATAGVSYGGRATMTLTVGNTSNISSFGAKQLYAHSEALYVSDTASSLIKINDSTSSGPEISCDITELRGGRPLGSYAYGSQTDYSSSEATLIYKGMSDTLVRITFSGLANSNAYPVEGAFEAIGSANTRIFARGWGILRIVNPGPNPVTLWCDYDIVSTSNSVNPQCGPGSYFGIRVVTACYELGTLSIGREPILINEGCTSTITRSLLTVGPNSVLYVELYQDILLTAFSRYNQNTPEEQVRTTQGQIDLYLKY